MILKCISEGWLSAQINNEEKLLTYSEHVSVMCSTWDPFSMQKVT